MEKEQVQLIKRAKKFMSSFNNESYAPQKDSIFYFVTTSNFIGSYILNSLSNIKNQTIFKNFWIIFKDVFYSLNYSNFEIINPTKNYEYDKIVVTWGLQNNFNKDGSLDDRYFNINSKSLKKTLWFVIYMSEEKPRCISDNIILLKPKKSKSLNIFIIFKTICKNILFLFKNTKYFLSLISNHNYFAQIFLKQIEPFLNHNIKKVLIPYEGQPFQNSFIGFLKNNFLDIKILGYIHSPPLAVPSNFIRKNDSPDQIILNGKDQLYCFTKILGWKKSSIRIMPSFRFIKGKQKQKNTIFLPLGIKKPEHVIDSLKFLHKHNYINIKKYKCKNHPLAGNSKNNLKLMLSVSNFVKTSERSKFKSKKNPLVFIGSSGAIIEALERGASVIQICEFPLNDIYSNKIWPSILSKKIRHNIYIYKIRKKGNLIKLGKKKVNLKNFFN